MSASDSMMSGEKRKQEVDETKWKKNIEEEDDG